MCQCISSREMVICIWPVSKNILKSNSLESVDNVGACEDDDDANDEVDLDTLKEKQKTPEMLYLQHL